MAIKYPITLSTTEPNNDVGVIKIRQADEQTQTLVVQVTENGVARAYTGLQVFFCAKIGQSYGLGIIEQKLLPEELVDPNNGQLSYTMRSEDWQHIGQQSGYFSFRKIADDGYNFVEQFSTRDFKFIITKSIFSDGITEVKKDGSTYVWTIEDLLRLFNEYIASGKTDWEYFVEQNKEIIESVDPGGLVLSELINARKGIDGESFDTIGERMDYLERQKYSELAGQIDVSLILVFDNLPEGYSMTEDSTVIAANDDGSVIYADISSEIDSEFRFEEGFDD